MNYKHLRQIKPIISQQELKRIISNIPDDEYREIISQKLIDNRTWTWIATNKGIDSPESVRKSCSRYSW